jgi:antitoxin component of MazEF toxin-antitoxin module
MRTHIQKWGNSLALRIPAYLLKRLDLHEGNAIDVDLEAEGIVVKKAKYDLDEMLDKITPENTHFLLMEDSPQGGEEW